MAPTIVGGDLRSEWEEFLAADGGGSGGAAGDEGGEGARRGADGRAGGERSEVARPAANERNNDVQPRPPEQPTHRLAGASLRTDSVGRAAAAEAIAPLLDREEQRERVDAGAAAPLLCCLGDECKFHRRDLVSRGHHKCIRCDGEFHGGICGLEAIEKDESERVEVVGDDRSFPIGELTATQQDRLRRTKTLGTGEVVTLNVGRGNSELCLLCVDSLASRTNAGSEGTRRTTNVPNNRARASSDPDDTIPEDIIEEYREELREGATTAARIIQQFTDHFSGDAARATALFQSAGFAAIEAQRRQELGAAGMNAFAFGSARNNYTW